MIHYFLHSWAVILLFTVNTKANTNNIEEDITTAIGIIESYLSSVDYENTEETVDIFTELLIVENDDLYTVDFMVTEEGEVIILSKEFEEEYYKVKNYSTVLLKKYTSEVAMIQ